MATYSIIVKEKGFSTIYTGFKSFEECFCFEEKYELKELQTKAIKGGIEKCIGEALGVDYIESQVLNLSKLRKTEVWTFKVTLK